MTKVDVISGFLGAGKTTFIKKLVEEAYKGEKIVLIENEFGEVGIDGGFMKDAGIEVSELNSGCICCSLVGDFGRNLKEVNDQFHPDRIIIEPSGVGKLSDVSASIMDVQEEGIEIEISSLITVVNAQKASKQMKAFGEFFENQVEFATTIVLSRSQSTPDEKLELCVKQLQEKNPNAAIITTPWDELDVNVILKAVDAKKTMMAELLEEAHKAHEEHEAEHDHEHHHDHDHEEHEHHHDHDHEEHEHHHHDDDEECCCGHHHDEEDHEHHHHDHDHEEHEHHHHDHDHEEHEHHHHDHDHEEHEHHHEHGEDCTCGCHDHDHHHHHADEVFTSVGIETPHKFDREKVQEALEKLSGEEYEDIIVRAKGIIPATDGSWIYFDMVPGEYELREGSADYTGRLVVIGTTVSEAEVRELFGC